MKTKEEKKEKNRVRLFDTLPVVILARERYVKLDDVLELIDKLKYGYKTIYETEMSWPISVDLLKKEISKLNAKEVKNE